MFYRAVKKRRHIIAGLLVSVAVIEGGGARAQAVVPPAEPAVDQIEPTTQGSGSEQVEEIVVTARRVSESLQDIPVAVTALTGETLRTSNILRTEDLQRVVPGLTAVASQRSDTAPNFTIRGQRGPVNPGMLTDPAVGIYFAEMNQSRSQGTNQAMFDLSSVQVVKGPQGTLFGRNSTGGAILITPNAPSDEFEGYVQGTIGNFEFRDLEGMINLPIANGIAIRGAAKVSERAGYMRNVITGQRANDLDAESYRLSLAFEPHEDFESVFIGTYYEANQAGSTNNQLVFVEPRGVPGSLGANRQRAVDLLQSELALTRLLGPYEFRALNPLYVTERVWSVQNNTEWQVGDAGILGDITLKNVIGIRDLRSAYSDERSGAADLFLIRGDTEGRLFTEEFQVQGDTSRLDYILGAYYLHEKGRDTFVNRNFNFLAQPNSISFPVFQNTDTDPKTKSYAAFIHGDYNLGSIIDGLSASGGLRYTRDEKEIVYRNLSYRGTNPTAFTCVLTGSVQSSPDRRLCSLPAKQTSSEVTYDLSLNYRVSSDFLVYVAHRSGYRAGGFNQTPLPSSPATRTYLPEFVKDYELGFKSDIRLGSVPTRLNLAAYHQSYSDIQRSQSTQNPTGGLTSQIINAAAAKIDGLEAELTMRPTPDLTVSATYAYVDARNTAWTDLYVAAGTVKQVDISDSPFSFLPKHQYSVSVAYRLPVAEKVGDITFTGIFNGQSDRTDQEIFTTNCGPDGRYLQCLNRWTEEPLPPFSLLNLRLDWNRVANSAVDFSLFVNNVTDRVYASTNINNVAALGTVSRGLGAPRMYGLQVRVNFGAAAR